MKPTSSDPLVRARHVSYRRQGRLLLDGIDVAVARGEIVTLIGPNGAGKSTLVRLLLGLLAPDEGEVRRVPGLRIGYAPQHLAIDPVLPLSVRHFLTLGGAAERRLLTAVLDRVGVPGMLDAPMAALSGGELQRVLLARALLRTPDLLVLDEPLSSVDIGGQAQLYRLIGDVRDETGAGVLLVSHDLHLVMARTDRVLCIDRHVCCSGHPVEVARDPAFARLFGTPLAEAVALYHHDLHHHARHAHGHEPADAAATGGPSP
jgi:zinc transport system ATP-binding protein